MFENTTKNLTHASGALALTILACIALLAASAASAVAAPITVDLNISAQDRYAVFHHDTDGDIVSYVTPPAPAAPPWVEGVLTSPAIDTWTISANVGDDLYVMVLNEAALPEPIGGMMLAQATMGSTVAETGAQNGHLWTSSNVTLGTGHGHFFHRR